MGICNVLAIVPFLCSAPAEEPPEEETVQTDPEMEAQPAPEVAVQSLTPPAGSRQLSEYQVLPPADEMASADEPREPVRVEQDGSRPGSFSDWVGQNWGADRTTASMEPVVEENEVAAAQYDLRTSTARDEDVMPMAEPRQPAQTQQFAVESRDPMLAPQETTPAPREPAREVMVASNEPATMSQPEPTPRVTTPPREQQMAAVQTPRQPVQPPRRERQTPVQPAATASPANWNPAQALASGSLTFAEPVAFTRQGQQVETDGISARKRRDARRLERELRRAARTQ